MKIIVSIGYVEHIFNADESEEAMDFALTSTLRQPKDERTNVEIIFKTEEE